MGVVRVDAHGQDDVGKDRGSVTVLMAGALMLVGLMLWGAGELGGATVQRSRAQTAADAAALAGAVEGESAAQHLAIINGGTLVNFTALVSLGGTDATATVDIGDARASATAHYDPPPPPPTVPPETSTTVEASDTVPPGPVPDPLPGEP